MNETNKTVLIIACVVAVALLVLLGGGAITGTMMSAGSGMTGSGTMGGIGWMWIPASIMLGLVVLLLWAIFAQKK